MTDRSHAEKSPTLPFGATEIHLDYAEYSDELAVRLAESGASDAAIDAAGGPGTAERLHDEDASATGDSLAVAGP